MIPIYFDDLAAVLTACTELRPDEGTPARIKELVAARLTHANPELAREVRAFDGPQLLALCAFVLQAQALVGMPGVSDGAQSVPPPAGDEA